MASFNKVILMGNLTRDPEVRVSTSGVTICKLGLAVSRVVRTPDGSTREETLFIDVDSFGKQAELLGKHMTKGRSILLEGRLRLDQWEGQNGEKRNKIVVVLENFQFVGSRVDNDPNMAASIDSRGDAQDSVPFAEDLSAKGKDLKPVVGVGDVDEDIPF
ncbi:MAG: single-stranded DNA-binding protein [Puniceicoccales bacterium]|jgi:single-strand DNA-binding protein|nr:single-stranded DNA-binding protein [Puniceicoccales bacterium]